MRRNFLRDETAQENQYADDLRVCYPAWPRHLIKEASIMVFRIMEVVEKRKELASPSERTAFEEGQALRLGAIPGILRFHSALLVLELLHSYQLAAFLKIFRNGVEATAYVREEEKEDIDLYSANPLRRGTPYMLGTAIFPWPRPDLISVRNLGEVICERPPWK